jgi:tRNA pseudouridine38-40 synthase
MENYKVTLAYEGKRYKGFRSIKGEEDKTIQGKLENILKKLFEKDIEVISAVNTDAGVSAAFQVVNFQVPSNSASAKKIRAYLDEFLPEDIITLKCEKVDERFHSRYLVKAITYEYRLWKSDAPHRPLFERRQVKVMEKPLNALVMEEAAKAFIGEHDFRAFATAAKVKSTIKEIFALEVIETDCEIIVRIKANGYLLHMERIIIGTLIQIGLYEKDIDTIKKGLTSLNEKYVGHKAMAGALCLVGLDYE